MQDFSWLAYVTCHYTLTPWQDTCYVTWQETLYVTPYDAIIVLIQTCKGWQPFSIVQPHMTWRYFARTDEVALLMSVSLRKKKWHGFLHVHPLPLNTVLPYSTIHPITVQPTTYLNPSFLKLPSISSITHSANPPPKPNHLNQTNPHTQP